MLRVEFTEADQDAIHKNIRNLVINPVFISLPYIKRCGTSFSEKNPYLNPMSTEYEMFREKIREVSGEQKHRVSIRANFLLENNELKVTISISMIKREIVEIRRVEEIEWTYRIVNPQPDVYYLIYLPAEDRGVPCFKY